MATEEVGLAKTRISNDLKLTHATEIQMKALPYIFLLLLTSGCGEVANVTVETGPTLQDAWLSSDKEGETHVTTYQPTDTVFVKADLIGAEAGTEVTAKFTAVAVDHPEVPPNTEVGAFTQKFDGTLNRMNFDFSNDGPMPSGSYKVDLSIAGKPAKTLTFTIPPATAP
ncbi:MAG: hypothetical protein KDA72_16050 [Planctomycetales bacterium]|nr:hypothetical protein [Planctomycetales bacterium]